MNADALVVIAIIAVLIIGLLTGDVVIEPKPKDKDDE